MTTIELEVHTLRHLKFNQNLIVPNVTPLSGLTGFEVDMLMLTDSGYAYAYELKVSLSDLKADKAKKHIQALQSNNSARYRHYFEELKYFYYIVPPQLQEAALKQIPEKAGLIVCNGPRFTYVKKAVKLFHKQWDEVERYKLARLCALRVYNMKRQIIKLQNKVKSKTKKQ